MESDIIRVDLASGATAIRQIVDAISIDEPSPLGDQGDLCMFRPLEDEAYPESATPMDQAIPLWLYLQGDLGNPIPAILYITYNKLNIAWKGYYIYRKEAEDTA